MTDVTICPRGCSSIEGCTCPPGPSEAELIALAERCEAATAEEQFALLSEAHYLIAGGDSLGMSLTSYRQWLPTNVFGKLLEAGAFTDAALMLVSDGWVGLVGIPANGGCQLQPSNDPFVQIEVRAATPGLAICAAALRARARQ